VAADASQTFKVLTNPKAKIEISHITNIGGSNLSRNELFFFLDKHVLIDKKKKKKSKRDKNKNKKLLLLNQQVINMLKKHLQLYFYVLKTNQ